MKLHRRELIVQDAESEFSGFYIDWLKKHELTYAEILSIFSSRLASMAKYAIRSERHPDDPDRPGGLE